MPFAGRNTVGATPEFQNDSDAQYIIDGPSRVLTAGANEEWFRVGFYCGALVGDGGVEVALYDVTDGTWELMGVQQITGLVADSWNTALVGTPVALTNGNDYAVGIRSLSTANQGFYYDYSNSVGAASADLMSAAFADPFVEANPIGFDASVYAETRTVVGANPGIRVTLRDAQNGNALLANETNVSVHVFSALNLAPIYSVTTETTDASGILAIDDDAVGSVSDMVWLAVVLSNGHVVLGQTTVIDLNA